MTTFKTAVPSGCDLFLKKSRRCPGATPRCAKTKSMHPRKVLIPTTTVAPRLPCSRTRRRMCSCTCCCATSQM
ncbi:hypothetical protein FKM82_006706 [Ascaphus truei]